MGNKVFKPKSLKRALKILDKKSDIKILAGGTDLILELDELKAAGNKLMDISKIDELRYIKENEKEIKIGALITFGELGEDKLINKYIPSLANASRQIGSIQIRNRATIGGNIANASPAADSMPVLKSVDAQIKVRSLNSSRLIPAEEAIASFYQNNLAENEIIEEIVISKSKINNFLFFDKVGSRKTVSIARLNIGANVKAENNLIKKAVICFGALSKRAFRAKNVESYLENKKINKIDKKEYNDKLKNVVDEAIPGRYSQQYKRNAICGLGDNLLKSLVEYAGKGE